MALSVSNPGFTSIKRWKLRPNNPAPTSRTTVRATCETMSKFRKRARTAGRFAATCALQIILQLMMGRTECGHDSKAEPSQQRNGEAETKRGRVHSDLANARQVSVVAADDQIDTPKG